MTTSGEVGQELTPRILFVEDDVQMRDLLADSLRREGYLVDEAGTGESGLVLFSRRGAEVVLVDGGLPGIDGSEMIAGCGRRPTWPSSS